MMNDESGPPVRINDKSGSPVRMNVIIQRLLFLGSIWALLWLAGCSSKITTRTGEYLLNNQIFRGNEQVKNDELQLLLPEKPNKKLFGIPGLTVTRWFYQGGLPRYYRQLPVWQANLDSSTVRYQRMSSVLPPDSRFAQKLRRKYNKTVQKYRNKLENGTWWMRTFGDAPVYISEAIARRNALKIRNYLVINQGYRAAKVGYELDTLQVRGQATVRYLISEGVPYKLRSVDILTHKDPALDTLLKNTLLQSKLQTGDNFQNGKVELETVRIEQLLRNNGYFGFSRQFLSPRTVENRPNLRNGGFLIDTSVVVPTTDSLFRSVDILGLQVNYPKGQNQHQTYRFSTVGFEVSSLNNPALVAQPLPDSSQYRGINYRFAERYYAPKVLDTKLLIRPGALFRQENLDETYRQLSLLDQFRFINVDTDTSGGVIKAVIRVVPQDKYQTTFETGANVIYNFPGPFANGTFRIRNVFRSLENFEIAGRVAYDLQTGFGGPQDFFRTLELGLNASLVFPRILFPGKWVNKLNTKVPRSIVSVGYNYINRLPFFTRAGFRANLSYSWRRSQFEFFNVTALDLNVVQTLDKSQEFQKLLDDLFDQTGSPLKFSFLDRTFVSSSSASYFFNNDIIGQNRLAHYVRFFAEAGGSTLNLLKTDKLPLLKDYEVYKFLKLNAEYRKYIPILAHSRLVFRANAGVVFSYDNKRAIPYEKFFTGGGSNSLRAWPPRRLGLGASFPDANADGNPMFRRAPFTLARDTTDYGSYNYRYEQLGNVLLEANLELRGRIGKLYGDLNYAIFIDIGNAWRLPTPLDNFSDTDKGSKLNLRNATFSPDRFLRELAVGTGVGLRWDFSYFIFRFDFGVKVYDPSRIFKVPMNDGSLVTVDERYLLPRFSLRRDSPNYPVLNIGIGYPF